MGKQILKTALILSLGFIFVQCSSKKDGVENLVSVSAVGGSPLLRHTSQTLGQRILTAPWFQTKLIIQNTSGKLIKIDFVRVIVDVNGEDQLRPDAVAVVEADGDGLRVTPGEPLGERWFVRLVEIERVVVRAGDVPVLSEHPDRWFRADRPGEEPAERLVAIGPLLIG